MSRKANREQILKDAWIGDAVLCLYARRRILSEDGITDDLGFQPDRHPSPQKVVVGIDFSIHVAARI